MPNNPDRRIKLTVSTQSVYTTNVTIGYRTKVVASNANLMPNEVFLWQHIPAVPSGPPAYEKFLGVCTPEQLTWVPVNNYDPTSTLRYYRTTTMDETYIDAAAATQAWLSIVEAVKQLKSSLDYNDGLTVVDYWVGTPPV